MAHVTQEMKNAIVNNIKKVLPKSWRASYAVQNQSTFVMTLRKMPKADLLDLVYQTKEEIEKGARPIVDTAHLFMWGDKVKNLNEVQYDFLIFSESPDGEESFNANQDLNLKSETAQSIKAIFKAINSLNHNNSDPHSDYFDVKYFVKFSIGSWDKPCQLI